MSDITDDKTYVTVALDAQLVDELHRLVGAGDFVDLDVLVETWLQDKLAEWRVARRPYREAGESVQDLLAEKERLMAWLANYVSAIHRSEMEMRNALDQIERLKSFIPRLPARP